MQNIKESVFPTSVVSWVPLNWVILTEVRPVAFEIKENDMVIGMKM